MPEQRRKHLRLPIESTTFIELLSPRLGQTDSGWMVTCKSMNVSRGGLQVILEEELQWAPSYKLASTCRRGRHPLPGGRSPLVPAQQERAAALDCWLPDTELR